VVLAPSGTLLTGSGGEDVVVSMSLSDEALPTWESPDDKAR
jgi:hypothetical protein